MTEPEARRTARAMSAEEWAKFIGPPRWRADRVEGRTLFVASNCGGEPYAEDVELDAHATAAKCLHGQLFGFTHEDVRRHREEARVLRRELGQRALDSQLRAPSTSFEDAFGTADRRIRERIRWYESMAERLAALLPPEEP
jgi:hypothetical protein